MSDFFDVVTYSAYLLIISEKVLKKYQCHMQNKRFNLESKVSLGTF